MNKKTVLTAASFIITSAVGVTPAFAATTTPGGVQPQRHGRGGPEFKGAFKFDASHMPIFGTVSAINGSSITITSKDNKTFTIDASKATIHKDPKTNGALSDITIGAAIVARGTVTGTTVAATDIMTGIPKMENHTPGIAGKVTAVSGSTITIESLPFGMMRGHGEKKGVPAKTPVSFTVTTTSSTQIMKGGASATLTDVAVGTPIMVRGTIDQTAHTVAATNIDLHVAPPKKVDERENKKHSMVKSVINKLGNLFSHKK